MIFLLLIIKVFYSVGFSSSVGQNVAVVTSKGTLVGQRADGYNTFLGVPYAEVDNERPFEDTRENPNFTSPFNASDSTIMCPQVLRSVGGIQQCLRLNIYAPTATTDSQGLPVFVWFHGGGFVMGNAGQYDPEHLTKHGVIVVTANYRLGPYGFLCIDGIRNQGLKDQKTALRWVKRNIGAFGGNSNNITIGGQSYGGGAVDFHLYSKEILFNKAIIESGSKFADGIVTRNDNGAPVKIAQQLGSNATKTRDALKFLSTANPIEVMRATRDLGLQFRVCKEKNNEEFSDKIKSIPILIGYNNKEDFAGFASQPDAFYKSLGDIYNTSLAKTFDLRYDILKNLADIVKRFYIADKDISKESMLELVDFSSDFKLNYAVERSVTNYLKMNTPRVYKYVFSYTGGSPYRNLSGVGAYHTEELQYIFEMDVKNQSEEQLTIKQRMTTMWTNFIKFGDPTPSINDDLPVKWTPTDLSSRSYLNIDAKMEMQGHVYPQRMAFWELLWSSYGKFRK